MGLVEPHPAVKHVLRYFEFAHLPNHLQLISKDFCKLAKLTALRAPTSPETTVALRKLLEAKDAAVRAALDRETSEADIRMVMDQARED